MPKITKIAIVGASGYTGALLTELLLQHPYTKIVYLCSSSYAEEPIIHHCPQFINSTHKLPQVFTHPEDIDYASIDCLFTAVPNGVARNYVSQCLSNNVKLIDLSADFRLDKDTFDEWYSPLNSPDQNTLDKCAYGLTEWTNWNKPTHIIANPGCYPTASLLGILPLLKEKLASTQDIIIDAKSGTTGAGKQLKENLLFTEIHGNFSAYNISKHRHTPEIEQGINAFTQNNNVRVRFTPHLLPMTRGILATIYLKPNTTINSNELKDCYKQYYDQEAFVHYLDTPPNTRLSYQSNNCFIHATYDSRSGYIICISVIDNLMKGASGQAIQNFNKVFHYEQTMGLVK